MCSATVTRVDQATFEKEVYIGPPEEHSRITMVK